jgi:hypothetical protein
LVRVEFNGPAILVVEVAKDTEEDGEFRPSDAARRDRRHRLERGLGGPERRHRRDRQRRRRRRTRVFAQGGDGNGEGLLADAGGDATGVLALGGPREGTGVFGLGGGGERLFRRGAGGKGVHGVGGIASLRDNVLPGVGVFGQGGQIREENTSGVLLGTGVIGVGGDDGNKDMPPWPMREASASTGKARTRTSSRSSTGTGTTFDGPRSRARASSGAAACRPCRVR